MQGSKRSSGVKPLASFLVSYALSRAGVAQLARASAFQAEGRGFESRRPLFGKCPARRGFPTVLPS